MLRSFPNILETIKDFAPFGPSKNTEAEEGFTPSGNEIIFCDSVDDWEAIFALLFYNAIVPRSPNLKRTLFVDGEAGEFVFRDYCKMCSLKSFNRLSFLVFETAFLQNRELVMDLTRDYLKLKRNRVRGGDELPDPIYKSFFEVTDLH
ncbi:MAG: hypothetical protein KVP17_002620 [Porospora cf. gigantea B]|uniref:uncharacterized protein n=1 Tax=Porospora cf. gigantea B TaxID=2853592 RepID=UPI003571D6C2|nr:MAG: hypothetical protein KVP17_002620 [Porospora cf. gigantea B]